MSDNESGRVNICSRRAFLSASVAAPLLAARISGAVSAANEIKIASPNRQAQFQLQRGGAVGLSYRVTLRGRPVIETSRLGIVLDGVDLGRGAEIGSVETYRVREKYAWRGAHSVAFNHCNGARISVRSAEGQTSYTVEARAYDDGVAFRFIVPGEGGRSRVPEEASAFTLPPGSVVWFHDFHGHYEGVHLRKAIEEVKEGEWAAPPLTIKLPDGAGYASITEAALMNYAGMGLQAAGRRGFKAVLGHAHPVNHPFELRYGAGEAKRLSQPASIRGEIKTPWRVVMAGESLDALVNCDIVHNVSPPPDQTLFPDGVKTEWLKPGRAVWKYLDGGENTLESMKEFSALAGQLGFEHNVVEGFWRRWSEAEMRELVEHSARHRVGVWFWKHSRDLKDPKARREFFELCRRVGVVGAKIDFLDHEAKEVIDHYQTLLRAAAEHKLMIDFHGANKPAGEARTWPNEMTREGVFGLEHRRVESWAGINTTLPFTRLLAGHADYTPVHFGERRRETSWAHQIATAAIFTSPVLIYGAHPKSLLENPAAEIIKSIPSVWDETRVLPASEIGQLAAFARRQGERWFLAVLNGPEARRLRVPLSFLGAGRHRALLARDQPDNPAAVKVETSTAKRADHLEIALRAGGGFVGRFDRA